MCSTLQLLFGSIFSRVLSLSAHKNIRIYRHCTSIPPQGLTDVADKVKRSSRNPVHNQRQPVTVTIYFLCGSPERVRADSCIEFPSMVQHGYHLNRKSKRLALSSCHLYFFTSFFNETTVHGIFGNGRCHQRAAKWGMWPGLRGFRPVFFMSKRHDLIRVATAGLLYIALPPTCK